MDELNDLLSTHLKEGALPQRRRSARADSNDRRLREALLDLVSARGWTEISMASLAQHAGFSPTVVRTRARDIAELGIDLWRTSVGPVFMETVTTTFAALRSAEPSAILASLHRWTLPSAELRAAHELLIASLFDTKLASFIRIEASRFLEEALDPSDELRRAADATMLGIAFAFTLGYSEPHRDVAAAHVPFVMGMYETDSEVSTDSALDPQVSALPPLQEFTNLHEVMTWTRAPETEDPFEAAILLATVDVLSTHGYRRATMARITKRAGVSAGAITSRHQDKAHLVAHAARTILMTPAEMDAVFEELRSTHGDAVTQTMWVRELLRSRHFSLWALRLDLALMATHEETLAEFTAQTITGPYYGYMLLACLVEGLEDLPLLGPITAGLQRYHDMI
jgi:AcrR family transcriptional regulator